MSDVANEVLRYPLQILKWCGQNPEENKIKYFIVTGCYLFSGTIALFLTILQIVNSKGDIIVLAQNCEAFVIFIELIAKILIGAIKTGNFVQMVEDTKRFWNVKVCLKDVREKIENNFLQILRLEQIFLRMVVFTTILALMAALITKQLPTGVWIMTDYKILYTCTLILQEILIPFAAVYIVGYDTLFLSFCVHLKAQFKMLNCSLRDLKVSVTLNSANKDIYIKKLRTYVRYHEFLLRFSKNLQNTYSPVLMIEFSTVLLVLCGEMFVLFESKEMFQFIRFSLAMASVLVQLAFYCIPLNYVADEALSISQGIYESEWCSHKIPVIKSIIPLVMQRSQKQIVFKAGGLIEMNCRTILTVLRISYSTCTVIRALKNV